MLSQVSVYTEPYLQNHDFFHYKYLPYVRSGISESFSNHTRIFGTLKFRNWSTRAASEHEGFFIAEGSETIVFIDSTNKGLISRMFLSRFHRLKPLKDDRFNEASKLIALEYLDTLFDYVVYKRDDLMVSVLGIDLAVKDLKLRKRAYLSTQPGLAFGDAWR